MPRPNPNTLDLHNFQASGWQFFETELFYKLDSFIFERIKSGQALKLEIIVGKGLSSKKWIEGKNPLRFYTEKYLNQANLEWNNGTYLNGGDGVILVYL